MMLRLEGLSNTEIASKLGLNETNVRKMVAQALKYLMGKWGDDDAAPGGALAPVSP